MSNYSRDLEPQDQYIWTRDPRTDELKSKYNGRVPARQLVEEHTLLSAAGNYAERHFHEAITYVLAKNRIEHRSEYRIKDGVRERDLGRGHRGRYADIYIPATDTAIELKLSPNLKGLGQATYYAQHQNEAILLTPGEREFSQEIANAVEGVPGVHYGTAIPGVSERPPVLDIMSDTEPDLFKEAKEGKIGSNRWLVHKANPQQTL